MFFAEVGMFTRPVKQGDDTASPIFEYYSFYISVTYCKWVFGKVMYVMLDVSNTTLLVKTFFFAN